MGSVTFRPIVPGQPTQPVAINWENPRTRGLIFSAFNSAMDYAAPFDYVSGRRAAVTAAVTSAVDAARGRVAKFNGTSSAVQFKGLRLSPYNNVCVSMWFWWDAFANDDKLLLEYGSPNFTNAGFIVDPDESFAGGMSIGIAADASHYLDFRGLTRPSAGAWHHFAMSIDRSIQNVPLAYWLLDGVQPGASSPANSYSVSAFADNDLNVMCRNAASLFGAGRVAYLNVWGRAVPMGEMREIYYDSAQILDSGRGLITVDATAALSTGNASRWFLAA